MEQKIFLPCFDFRYIILIQGKARYDKRYCRFESRSFVKGTPLPSNAAVIFGLEKYFASGNANNKYAVKP
jgi:hypothetical protein